MFLHGAAYHYVNCVFLNEYQIYSLIKNVLKIDQLVSIWVPLLTLDDNIGIKPVPLLNMTSAAPLSVVLSLLPQRKEEKRGRSVSHV